MGKRTRTTIVCMGLGAAATGACGSMHGAGGAVAGGGGAIYHGGASVYRTSSSMVATTMGETYNGLGGAAKRPFRDFNLMQEGVPAVLTAAAKAPYDTAGLTSCEVIGRRVAELDLALGPDIDIPKMDQQRSRWARASSSAADFAVEAATGAADHFIPVRGVIRHMSGAERAEKQLKEAVLAGSIRRGFLKAVGMQQNCGWPAAPVDFHPLTPLRVEVAALALPPVPGAAPPVTIAARMQLPAGAVAPRRAADSPLASPYRVATARTDAPQVIRVAAPLSTSAVETSTSVAPAPAAMVATPMTSHALVTAFTGGR